MSVYTYLYLQEVEKINNAYKQGREQRVTTAALDRWENRSKSTSATGAERKGKQKMKVHKHTPTLSTLKSSQASVSRLILRHLHTLLNLPVLSDAIPQLLCPITHIGENHTGAGANPMLTFYTDGQCSANNKHQPT